MTLPLQGEGRRFDPCSAHYFFNFFLLTKFMIYNPESVEPLDNLVGELYSKFKEYVERTEDGKFVPEIDRTLSCVWKRREVIYHLVFLETNSV